jgi:tRNA (mo5U34)-methyltransferase
LRFLGLPEDLTGKSVLDVGAWDGFFSFECERRGAARVLAIDTYAWDVHGKDGFLLAHSVLRSKVESMRLAAEQLHPDTAAAEAAQGAPHQPPQSGRLVVHAS